MDNIRIFALSVLSILRSGFVLAGLTMSIWYPDQPMCELEPIGPREKLAPDESASFTEVWQLLPHPYPQDGKRVDLKRVAAQVRDEAS